MSAVAEKEAPKAAKKGYVPPDVNDGDIVMWFKDGKREGEKLPAVVVAFAGQRQVRLGIMGYDGYGLHVPEATVPHMEDPDAHRMARSDSNDDDEGAWDHIPGGAATLLPRYAAENAELKRRLDSLQDGMLALEQLVQERFAAKK